MKNLKVNFIALVALVIGIVTMSFKLTEGPTANDEKWFEYTNATNDNDPNNPANYELANGNGNSLPPCPQGNEETCAVLALPQIENEELPNLNSVITTELRKQQ